MADTEQAIVLTPSDKLCFEGPSTEIVSANLKLTNPSSKRICFKVKTTSPRIFCVRPNSGILDPKSDVSIAVIRDGKRYASSSSKKNSDKFKVLFIYIPGNAKVDCNVLWKNVSKSDIMENATLKAVMIDTDFADAQELNLNDNVNKDGLFRNLVSPSQMTNESQVLIVSTKAEALRFQGPFTKDVHTDLNLMNPTEKDVSFKIKTTAPCRYLVRPNSGCLKPKAQIDIKVVLVASEFNQEKNSKDKFAVMSMFIPDDNEKSIEQLASRPTSKNRITKKDKAVQVDTIDTFDDHYDRKTRKRKRNVKDKAKGPTKGCAIL